MRMVDLIEKKKLGKSLSEEEIYFWINGLCDGSIPDYQSSAMTMAIYFKGMTFDETFILTKAMINSGKQVDLSSISGIKVDKHSTGGVGDTTSIVVLPMVSACGCKVAKMSGKGLGHTGGTIDKFESIPGFSTQLNNNDFISQVNKIGLSLIGASQDVALADKKLYALRDVTGTVNSIPLIASSIMSKKLASGSDTILLDVTFGKGAFMNNINDAKILAETMVKIGNFFGKNTIAVISNMNQPLGNAIGNILEIKEAISCLKGNGPKDLMELCYKCGSIMLVQSKLFDDEFEAKKALEKVIEDGSAYKKFLQLVEAQGGDINYINNPDLFPVPKVVISLHAKESGYISEINSLKIGLSAMRLGAGRATKEDSIDYSAGIVLNVKVGSHVEKGDVIATLYTNIEDYQKIFADVGSCFKYSKYEIKEENVIMDVIY